MRHAHIRALGAAAVFALALGACGSSDETSTGADPTAAPTKTPAGDTPTTKANAEATFALADNATIGAPILVDAKGMTLYLWEMDADGKSNCNGDCATAWPPVAPVDGATYGDGLSASMFTVITRDDGSQQVAVNGHPLYLWAADKQAGDATGQDVNEFYVVGANGEQVEDQGGDDSESDDSSPDTTIASSGLGGY